MLTDELSVDRVKFDAVWGRVMSGEKKAEPTAPYAAGIPQTAAAEYPTATYPGEPGGELERLCRFMDEAAALACHCRKIAAKCPGRIYRTLCCIAEDERCHLKKLRTKYFILSGGAYCPEETCPPVCTVSEGLRELYAGLVSAGEQYLAAADNARFGLAQTYREFACDEQRHADSVEGLIESMMR